MNEHTPSLSEVANVIAEIKNIQGVPFDVTSAWARYISSSKQYSLNENSNEKAGNILRFKNQGEYGEYTEHETKVFDDINKGLKQYYMTASTLSCFGMTDAKTEKKVAGLRSRHAYAIASAFPKFINGRTVKFIRLYNPWGKTGRRYIFKGMQYQHERNMQTADKDFAIEDKNVGHFDVELSDFIKYFKNYAQCPRFELVGKPEVLVEQQHSSDDENEWLLLNDDKGKTQFNSQEYINVLLSTILVKLSKLDINTDYLNEMIGSTLLIVKGQQSIEPSLCIDLLTPLSATADALKRQLSKQHDSNSETLHELDVINSMLDETITQLEREQHCCYGAQ